MCYNISISKNGNSSVAQLVEQMTVNHWVAGSNPARGANVDGSSIGRAPDCGSGGCEFDSHPSTHKEIVSETKIVLYMLIIAILIGILAGKILAILYI